MKKILLLLIILLSGLFSLDRYSYNMNNKINYMYVFGFNDHLQKQIIENDLSQYHHETIAYNSMGGIKEANIMNSLHKALFEKVLKGATMIILVEEKGTVSVMPRDTLYGLGYYMLEYQNINSADVNDWLMSQSVKKAGNPMMEAKKEAEKIIPLLEKQQAENLARYQAQQEAYRKMEEERKRKEELAREKRQWKYLIDNKPKYFKQEYREKIEKDYPELLEEYEQEAEKVQLPQWWQRIL